MLPGNKFEKNLSRGFARAQHSLTHTPNETASQFKLVYFMVLAICLDTRRNLFLFPFTSLLVITLLLGESKYANEQLKR